MTAAGILMSKERGLGQRIQQWPNSLDWVAKYIYTYMYIKNKNVLPSQQLICIPLRAIYNSRRIHGLKIKSQQIMVVVWA